MLLTDGTELKEEHFPMLNAQDSGFSAEVALPAAGINLEALERSLVVQALERSGWNQTKAATLLGLNRDQIRYRIEKFKLERHPAQLVAVAAHVVSRRQVDGDGRAAAVG